MILQTAMNTEILLFQLTLQRLQEIKYAEYLTCASTKTCPAISSAFFFIMATHNGGQLVEYVKNDYGQLVSYGFIGAAGTCFVV